MSLTECALTHIQHAPNSYVTKAYVRIGRKKGQRKGHSGRSLQDVARRLPDPQGEKRNTMNDITVRTASAVRSLRENLVNLTAVWS